MHYYDDIERFLSQFHVFTYTKIKKQKLRGPQSARELYRLSDRHFL
jgi:hypothetical protein